MYYLDLYLSTADVPDQLSSFPKAWLMFTENSTEIISSSIVQYMVILALENDPYAPSAGLEEVLHVCG